MQNPVAQVVVAIPWGHGPFAIPGQGGMLIGYARVSTQETREQSPEKRRRTPLTTFWAAETQLGEPPHCVRSRLRRMQAPQRSSETPRLACKIAPICLIPSVRIAPGQGQRKPNRPELPIQGSPRVKEDQDRLAGVELRDGQRGLDPASFNPGYRPAQSRPANELISPFPASRRPVSGPACRVGLLGMPHNPERPGGRKSLISTGLCDSGQFSTCKAETPQAHKYVQSGNMYPRKYVQSGNIYM